MARATTAMRMPFHAAIICMVFAFLGSEGDNEPFTQYPQRVPVAKSATETRASTRAAPSHRPHAFPESESASASESEQRRSDRNGAAQWLRAATALTNSYTVLSVLETVATLLAVSQGMTALTVACTQSGGMSVTRTDE